MSACICELDRFALAAYRDVEYGRATKEPMAERLDSETVAWIGDHVRQLEASCAATLHYPSLLLDEWLARDVTLDADDRPKAYREFYAGQDEDDLAHLHRFDAGADAEPERDEELELRVRRYEMTKRRELFEAIRFLELDPAAEAGWVKRRVAIKRADALAEKARQDAACWQEWIRGERLDTESFPLPSESQIRLRAYASCLVGLRKRAADVEEFDRRFPTKR
jgi:hypothetical protein